MKWLKQNLVVIGRVMQVTFSLAALGISIELCMPSNLNLTLAIPAAFCCGAIAMCGLLAVLAMRQIGSVHLAMVLSLDLLGLAYCVGAAIVLTLAFDNWWWNLVNWTNHNVWGTVGYLYVVVVLVYLCLAILLAMATRSYLMWRRDRRSLREGQIKEVDQSESWSSPVELQYTPPKQHHELTAVQPRFSQDHNQEARSPTSPRPLSTVESMANWSTVSGGATLTQPPSVRSFDTKRPPSYASPVPSRGPTTIHRKPVY